MSHSVSRVIIKREYYYPIQELRDLFRLFDLAREPYNLDPYVLAAYDKFQARVKILTPLKSDDISGISPELLVAPPHFTKELFDYQKPIVAQMLLMKRYLLALEVGLGKTILSLFTILKLKEIYPDLRALVVCESGHIHKPWLDSIYGFTDLKMTTIIDGPREERLAKIANASADRKKNWLWISGYDSIRIDQAPVQMLDAAGMPMYNTRKQPIMVPGPNIFPLDWDIIIFDEITKLKNVSSQAAQAAMELTAEFKFGLSATPILNTYFDLYGVMKIINPYVFSTKANFTEAYLKLDFFQRPVGLKDGVEAEVNTKLFPWLIQKVKADISEVKPTHIKTIPVPLTFLQQQELNSITNDIDNGDRSAFESGTALRQLCNTLKVMDPYKDSPIDDTTNKISKLKELLKDLVDNQCKKVVVFSYFKGVVEIIQEQLESLYRVRVITGESRKTCKRPDIQDCCNCPLHRAKCNSVKKNVFDFVEGDVQILLGTDSLSRAHNLYTADTIINYDLPWNSADLKQRIGRIDRASNQSPEFFVYNIVTLGTIEEKIIKKIERKEKEQGKVLPKYNVSLSKLSKTITVK